MTASILLEGIMHGSVGRGLCCIFCKSGDRMRRMKALFLPAVVAAALTGSAQQTLTLASMSPPPARRPAWGK